jgi:sugar phosphate isomerase/epimerase
MALDPPRLLGSFWTLAVGAEPLGDQRCHHDFRRRVEIAARAGFTAMGFWHTDIVEIRRSYSFREMRDILHGNGITDVEVEWLLDWYCTDERRKVSDQTRQLLLDAAEALGARHIKVADLGNDCADLAQMTEEFGQLCRQAAERGTRILFEMLPAVFSRLPSLQQVLSLCRDCGQKNGGILLDNLHVQRIGTPLRELQNIGPEIPLGIEINDGVLATPVNFQDSVVNKRLLPGDGEFDITAFLHALWGRGYDGLIGVEVLNEYIRKWPLELAATEAFTKARRVVEQAHNSWQATRSALR